MGIGYTIDSPLKVAQYGIDSVISLVDDILLEKLRKVYAEKFELPYQEISNKIEDFRAKRITSYLNLINEVVENKFEELKNSTLEKGSILKEYFDMLPDTSTLKQEFFSYLEKVPTLQEMKVWLKDNLTLGSIDVNIMTKVDKENYLNGEKLPSEYNDAHAALRGFAESDLTSSVILSAGMSPRLYGYIENFNDFYPNEKGEIKKKIVIKVSDYRSALIQGKFFAKKGLWVSEYRIESGLNCGGHAFATDGFLMGPILEEFKQNRETLIEEVSAILVSALERNERVVPAQNLALKITAQGGVGTGEEHQFLLDHYKIDSVGWGSPFLLVPEATTVDDTTMQLLADAQEKDLYLSGISPLGVPFNSLRGNTKDIEKMEAVKNGRPGSSCPKEFLVSNKEFTDKSICTASRQYQRQKIKELDQEGLNSFDYKGKFDKIIEKACICVGLGTPALLINNMDTKVEGVGVTVCPGPNMAYFSKVKSLFEMTSHIYDKTSFSITNRPHMFVKELNLYLDYLSDKLDETKEMMTGRQEKYLKTFSDNLKEGISYYQNMFIDLKESFSETKTSILSQLNESDKKLQLIKVAIEEVSVSV
ncbi:MAG TPA: hypothetical protein EYG92_04645 [Lutibacter sp.]|nr:hypothetical protein [Lutibacter sp.]